MKTWMTVLALTVIAGPLGASEPSGDISVSIRLDGRRIPMGAQVRFSDVLAAFPNPAVFERQQYATIYCFRFQSGAKPALFLLHDGWLGSFARAELRRATSEAAQRCPPLEAEPSIAVGDVQLSLRTAELPQLEGFVGSYGKGISLMREWLHWIPDRQCMYRQVVIDGKKGNDGLESLVIVNDEEFWQQSDPFEGMHGLSQGC